MANRQTKRQVSIERMSSKGDTMNSRGVHWSWQLLGKTANIGSDGVKESRVSQSHPLQLWLPGLHPKTSRIRSFRSSYLWGRVRWLLIGYRSMASESEFVLWLRRNLEVAEFGALTLGEVKSGARLELELDDDHLLRYLLRHTSPGAEFRSDGDVITFRG